MSNSNRHHHSIFYGWWIVAACLLINTYASGVIFLGFTTIFEPIAKDFSWSYAKVSLAVSLRGFEGGFLAPLVGLLFTRIGARKLMFTGVAITSLSLLLLSRINSLWMFYVAILLATVGMSTIVGVVPMAVVGNWFRKKVTLATGIVVSGTAVGGLMLPLLTQIIDVRGWRAAMVIIGLGALGILLPLSLVVRHNPEQYGYLPDGETSSEPISSEVADSSQSTEAEIGVRQAMKGRAFWQITLGTICNFLMVVTTVTHVMPYLSTIGFTRSASSLVASAMPLTSILGRLGFGWLGDRFDKRLAVAAGCVLIGSSLLLFSYIAAVGTWLIVPFIICFGIGWGSGVPMHPALLRERFGRTSLGAILGFSLGISQMASMAGPPLAGWVYDNFGSYFYAWIALVGVAIAGVILFLTAPSVSDTKRIVNNLESRKNTI